MTTPQYVAYFHGLPQAVKDRLNREQWQHYRGVSSETLEQIHDLLYQRELKSGLRPVQLACGLAVERSSLDGSDVRLTCRQRDTNAMLELRTCLVVAATGYRECPPDFLEPVERWLRRDEQGRYRVRLDYSVELDPAVSGRVYVSNAELHSHGVATPDLGISAYRNATILNAILGRDVYALPRRTAFTSFGLPAMPFTREARTPSRALDVELHAQLGAK